MSLNYWIKYSCFESLVRENIWTGEHYSDLDPLGATFDMTKEVMRVEVEVGFPLDGPQNVIFEAARGRTPILRKKTAK